jgi:hypothetical protein
VVTLFSEYINIRLPSIIPSELHIYSSITREGKRAHCSINPKLYFSLLGYTRITIDPTSFYDPKLGITIVAGS